MNDTTVTTSPGNDPAPEGTSILIGYYYQGYENGKKKSGWDSRVVTLPVGQQITNAADLKEISDAIAESSFKTDKPYIDLEVSLMYLVELPVGKAYGV